MNPKHLKMLMELNQKLHCLLELKLWCELIVLVNIEHLPSLAHPQAPLWTQLQIQRCKQQNEKELGHAL